MKKPLCALFALLLILCAGCAGHAQPAPTSSAPAETATPSPSPPPTPAPTPTPTPGPTAPPTLLGETADMGQDYMDSIVFYGDSNTNGLRLLEMLPGGYNTNQIWTPMSGTLTLSYWSVNQIVYPETWTEMSVADAMETRRPDYLIINLGENGVSFMDEEYFTSEYAKMVEALAAASPDTKIMLSSLYPVAASYPYQKDISNDKITAANGWIYDIAVSEGVRYLDAAAAVRGEDGSLPENLHQGDGYHLNKDGFNLVLDYIRTHGYQ